MKKYELLLVDDDSSMLKTVALYLENINYSVTKVSNGVNAIPLLKEKQFDLIITDLIMVPVNGIEVLKKAKEINPENMVMILTAHGDMKSAIEALRNGADDYLLKPCEKEEISFRVKGLLEKLEYKRKLKLYEKVLPMCCVCKKIRDDTGTEHGKGKWTRLEEYIHKRAGILPSHGYCPECYKEATEKMEEYINKKIL